MKSIFCVLKIMISNVLMFLNLKTWACHPTEKYDNYGFLQFKCLCIFCKSFDPEGQFFEANFSEAKLHQPCIFYFLQETKLRI